jgi:hypothetical protein
MTDERSLQHDISEGPDICEMQVGFRRPSLTDIRSIHKGLMHLFELPGEDPIVEAEASKVVGVPDEEQRTKPIFALQFRLADCSASLPAATSARDHLTARRTTPASNVDYNREHRLHPSGPLGNDKSDRYQSPRDSARTNGDSDKPGCANHLV